VVVSGKAVRRTQRSVAGPGSYRVAVPLTPEFRQRLKAESRLAVRAKVVFRPRSGAAVSRNVTLSYVQPSKTARAGR
jgi:hypothetical protein